jgi:hypothetical protein
MVGASVSVARASEDLPMSYPGHVARVLDVCPFVKVSHFSWGQEFNQTFKRLYAAQWANVGKKSVVAFELRVLRVTPFGESLPDFVQVVPGHNSGDYTPLQQNEHSTDIGLHPLWWTVG